MRLSGTNEVYLVVGLAVMSAVAPKLLKPVTGGVLGRALSVAIAAYLALYVSMPVALFWTIAVHASMCNCAGGMEYMTGQCSANTSQDKCTGDCMWDGSKCMDKPATSMPVPPSAM
jgi:hypothetical protein